VTVSAGGESAEIDLEIDDCPAEPCPATGVAELPAVETGVVVVRLERVQPRATSTGSLPARLAEVEVSGPAGTVTQQPAPTGTTPTDCATGLLTVDGAEVPIRLPEATGLAGLLAGEPVGYESCDEVALGAGRHELRAPVAVLDRVLLSSGTAGSRPAPTGADSPDVEVLERARGEVRLRVRSDDPMLVSTGQSYDPDWSAEIDGEPAGSARAVDTLSAWEVPAGEHVVTLTFGPERAYRWALAATIVGLVLCVAILVWPRPRGGDG
jgi:arabinofuranan 3-O-arabinosyltransferase